MDDLNSSRQHIISALYEKAVFVGTIKDHDNMLVLFRTDALQGARTADHARRSFNHYYGTEIPEESILRIGGYAGMWLPYRSRDEQGAELHTPEYQYLQQRAYDGSIAAVQHAADEADFNRQYRQCMHRLNMGGLGRN